MSNMSKKKSKQLVNDATKDDRKPPPGYIMTELANRTSTISESSVIEEALLKRLAKTKPYVKYKALRVIKFICENGSSAFRRLFQNQTDKLRDCQQFRGPPDPIYGDSPYDQVRKAAKDAMSAVFASISEKKPTHTGITSMSSDSVIGDKNKSQGFDPADYGVNVKNSEKTKTSTFSKIGSYFKKKQEEKTKDSRSFEPPSGFEPKTNRHDFGSYTFSSGDNKISRKNSKKRRKPNNVPSMWQDSDPEEDDNDENKEEGEKSDEDEESESSEGEPKIQAQPKRRNNVKSDGRYEKKWLSDIIKSCGVGTKINDLGKYVRQFENLSKSHILSGIDKALIGDDWQKTGKALNLVIGLLDGKSKDEIIEYFQESPENLMELTNYNKVTIKKKAKNICNKCDIQFESTIKEPQQVKVEEPQVVNKEENFIGVEPSKSKSSDILGDTDKFKKQNQSEDENDGLNFDELEVPNKSQPKPQKQQPDNNLLEDFMSGPSTTQSNVQNTINNTYNDNNQNDDILLDIFNMDSTNNNNQNNQNNQNNFNIRNNNFNNQNNNLNSQNNNTNNNNFGIAANNNNSQNNQNNNFNMGQNNNNQNNQNNQNSQNQSSSGFNFINNNQNTQNSQNQNTNTNSSGFNFMNSSPPQNNNNPPHNNNNQNNQNSQNQGSSGFNFMNSSSPQISSNPPPNNVNNQPQSSSGHFISKLTAQNNESKNQVSSMMNNLKDFNLGFSPANNNPSSKIMGNNMGGGNMGQYNNRNPTNIHSNPINSTSGMWKTNLNQGSYRSTVNNQPNMYSNAPNYNSGMFANNNPNQSMRGGMNSMSMGMGQGMGQQMGQMPQMGQYNNPTVNDPFASMMSARAGNNIQNNTMQQPQTSAVKKKDPFAELGIM